MQEDQSLLGEMNSFFDKAGSNQTQPDGTKVIRASVSNQDANLELYYSRLADMGFNLNELKAFLECETHMLGVASAGAGKTTGLVLKIIRDLIKGTSLRVSTVSSVYGETQVLRPANILISTFLKSGADDIKSSFYEWCRKLNITGLDTTTIQFRTIHSEVLDALKFMGVSPAIITDTLPHYRAVMNTYSIRSINSTSRSATIDEINDVMGIVAYARNRLDDKRYDQPLMSDYRIDSNLLNVMLDDLKKMRMAANGMDFEDMQEVLLEALRSNPAVEKVIADRYDYVYVDEFQDTSQLQYEILKYYFKGSRQVVAIGDDDQTIYSWRGSDIDIILKRFVEDMQPTIITLSTNYRCRKNILDSVIPSIEKNTGRHDKTLKAFKEGGEVNVVLGGSVNMLVNSIREDMANNRRVGVLARVNADLLIPALILELDGGVEYSLSKSVNLRGRMAQQIFGAIDLVTKRFTEEFEAYFKMFLSKWDWHEAEKLSQVLMMNRKTNLYDIPDADLSHSVPNLYPFLKGLRSAREMDGVQAYLYILGCMENQVFDKKSSYAQKAKILVQFVRKLVLEHDSVKDKSIGEMSNLFGVVLPERLAQRAKYAKEAPIRLTTVHEAKGKEWDSVFIWNNVQDVFPNKVGNRETTPEEYEEERRVHYIAWTRAKDKLTIFSQPGKMGDFLTECDLTIASEDSYPDEEQREMKKVYRKKTSDADIEVSLTDEVKKYIERVLTSMGLSSQLVCVDLVMKNYTVDEVVRVGKEKYGLEINYSADVMDRLFEGLSDELANSGKFQA